MVPGVLRIPLPGWSFGTDRGLPLGPHRGSSLREFVAGPENVLAVAAVHSLVAAACATAPRTTTAGTVQSGQVRSDTAKPGTVKSGTVSIAAAFARSRSGVPEACTSDGSARFPLVVFYGQSGTGKTHLASGVAGVWESGPERALAESADAICAESNRCRTANAADRVAAGRDNTQYSAGSHAGAGGSEQPSAQPRVLYRRAGDFARDWQAAVRNDALTAFRRAYRGATLLVLEHLDHLVPHEGAQQELALLVDRLLRRGATVIVTCLESPTRLRGLCPRLRSRLLGGLLVPLAPPGAEARSVLLEQLAAERGVAFEPAAAALLAERSTGTVLELQAAVLELAAAHEGRRRSVSPAAIEHLLAARAVRRTPPLAEVARLTARQFGLKVADLKSASRRRGVARARGVAMYLSRALTGTSLQQIGRYYGRRDHSTVLHACRQTERLLADDPSTRVEVDSLRAALQAAR